MSERIDPMDLLKTQDTDAMKWSISFNQTAIELGYQPMDEGWLVAWFANAMCVQMDSTSNKKNEEIQFLKAMIVECRPWVEDLSSMIDLKPRTYETLEQWLTKTENIRVE